MLSDELYALATRPIEPTIDAINERVVDLMRLAISDIGVQGKSNDCLLADAKRANNLWNGLIVRLQREHHPMGQLLKEDGLAMFLARQSGLDVRTKQEYYH